MPARSVSCASNCAAGAFRLSCTVSGSMTSMLSIELTSPRRMLPLAVRSRISLYFTASASSVLAVLELHAVAQMDHQMRRVLPLVPGGKLRHDVQLRRRCRTACRTGRQTRCARHRRSRGSDRAGRDPRADRHAGCDPAPAPWQPRHSTEQTDRQATHHSLPIPVFQPAPCTTPAGASRETRWCPPAPRPTGAASSPRAPAAPTSPSSSSRPLAPSMESLVRAIAPGALEQDRIQHLGQPRLHPVRRHHLVHQSDARRFLRAEPLAGQRIAAGLP